MPWTRLTLVSAIMTSSIVLLRQGIESLVSQVLQPVRGQDLLSCSHALRTSCLSPYNKLKRGKGGITIYLTAEEC